MKKMFLSEIIASVNAEKKNLQGDFIVTGISTDTRSLRKGDLYIAIKGKTYDGHNFVSVAQTKGASAAVCSDNVVSTIPILKVNNTLAALQQIAAYYRTKFDIPVIGVTGSNGKTTTKNMIATILSAKYKVFFTDKNYNNEIGLPKSVLELDDSYDVAVFEMGMNHFGELTTLTNIAKPDIAIITNIGKAHIGNFGSQENIFKAKMEIIKGLKTNGLVILSGDDPFLQTVHSESHKVVFVGSTDFSNRLIASNINASDNSTQFDIKYLDKIYPCTIPTIGKHNVTNALLAIYCGIELGIDIQSAIEELRRFTVSSMRTEISYIKGITIIKDYYNASPDSSKAALETLANYNTKGKKIAILGEMLELGELSEQEHLNLAKICCEQSIDYVLFIGSDYQSFKKGITKNGECFSDTNREALIRSLKNYITQGSLNSGDVVLIKGSRKMKMEEFYESIKSFINSFKSDFASLPSSPTKLYVDISSVKFNYFQIKKAVGNRVEIMPMVKANAYGAGTDIIANVFHDSKYLAVADAKEAALIRRILPNTNFIIIYQPYAGNIKEIVAGNYIASVSNLDFAEKLNEESGKQFKKSKIHIEIDTGAGRLGINTNDCLAFARKIKTFDNLVVEGVFMHYCCADSFNEEDLEFTKRQTTLFIKAIADIEKIIGKVLYKHACAGAAIFNQSAAHFSMVRPGYMLYGYYPSDTLRDKVLLKPALKFVSVILQIKEYDEGTSISYNRTFVTKRKSRIATVSVGYSDGISRKLFNAKNNKNGCFVVNGQRASIVGTICMDLTMVDITDIEGDVKVGDEVAIFDNVNVTIEEIAEIGGTIGYEIISQIEDKADRVESF